MSADLQPRRNANAQKHGYYVGEAPVWPLLERATRRIEFTSVENRLRVFNTQLPSGWPIGLEQELLRRGIFKLDLSKPVLRNKRARAIRFADNYSAAHLFDRPPSELAAYRLWQMLNVGDVSAENLCELSHLLGGPSLFRSARASTTPFASGHVIDFLSAEKVQERLTGLLMRFNRPHPRTSPIAQAIGVFLETLLIHPLPDGNGRLARLLFQGALKRAIGLNAPVVPLGPSLINNRDIVIYSYLAWAFDHSPQPLIRLILTSLDSTLSAQIHEGTQDGNKVQTTDL